MNGLKEIRDLFAHSESISSELDFEKGILQAIGYKEFYSYHIHMFYKYFGQNQIDPIDEDDKEQLDQAKLRLKNKTM